MNSYLKKHNISFLWPFSYVQTSHMALQLCKTLYSFKKHKNIFNSEAITQLLVVTNAVHTFTQKHMLQCHTPYQQLILTAISLSLELFEKMTHCDGQVATLRARSQGISFKFLSCQRVTTHTMAYWPCSKTTVVSIKQASLQSHLPKPPRSFLW